MAAGSGLHLPGSALAQGGAWATAPKSKVDKLNFVVWTYGDIYTKIDKNFQADWGVPVESTISSFNDHPTKLMTMFAGGDAIDVSQSSPFSFVNFISQGLVEPLDDLPGAKEYAADFTAFTKQVAVVDGKLMGLPSHEDRAFATYDDVEQAFYEVDAPPALILNEWNAVGAQNRVGVGLAESECDINFGRDGPGAARRTGEHQDRRHRYGT